VIGLDIDHAIRATEKFIRTHEVMIERTLESSGKTALRTIHTNPGFKPKTGRLQRNSKARVMRTAGGRLLKLTNNTKYGPAIERGSKPHTITAKRGRALRFKSGSGKWVFRRSVKHPGNRPYWFMRNAQGAAFTTLYHTLNRGMSQVASRFGR